MNKRYEESERTLERALKVIPHASQTFSKSLVQYPKGASPFFIDSAKGSRVWDVDGNEYTDFVNSLLSINLGYQDEDVVKAVTEQLQKGTIFSLPSTLETEVAELLVKYIPSAEMVRFAKNGSDATSGAIRIARAFTKREKVVVCGYHGWQDWYIGTTTKDEGIPSSTKELSFKFEYNNIESLREIFSNNQNEIAAVIMEPMNIEFPNEGFLQEVKDVCHDNGSLLIFDETITGFRFSIGGAQELFGVTPDLSTFGKGIANGYPLSALVGRMDVMKKMEDVFFSGTFGGECLSLVAAKTVINKLVEKNVVSNISEKGTYLIKELEALIESFDLGEVFHVTGHPSWSFLVMKPYSDITPFDLKTLFMQTCHEEGFLCLGTHNLSYAHTKEDIDNLLKTYHKFFTVVKNVETRDQLLKKIYGEVLVPLFKVRE